jgi:lipoprotein signal peptidase
MRRSILVLATAAACVLATDLAHKAYAVAQRGDELLYHERSLAYAVGITVASALWCAALLATRSVGLSLAGGVLLGGALGNALSWTLWIGIPNPFLVGDIERGLAFNVADVAVLAGVFVVLPPALAAFAVGNRHRLREPVRLRG